MRQIEIERVLLILASTAIGFAVLCLPVWYWANMQFWFWSWTPIFSGTIGAAIGALLTIEFKSQRRVLRSTALDMLIIWLICYSIALARVLPHCEIEYGRLNCALAAF